MRLANRMTLWILLVLTLVLLAQGLQRVQRVADNLADDARRDHVATSVMLRDATEEMWAARGREEALALLAGIDLRRADRSVRWVRLAPSELGESPRAPAEVLADLVRGDPVHWSGQSPDGEPTLYTYVRVATPGAEGGAIELGESLGRQRAYVRATLWRVVAWLALLLVAVAVAVHAMGRAWIGRPVQELIGHARRVGDGDLAARLAPGRPDELGELASELNAMTSRLADAIEETRAEANRRLAAEDQLRHADRLAIAGRLSASIAHELGTPLNVVRLHAQLMQSGEVDAVPESAGAIVAQCDRMSGLISQMLDFVRPRQRGEVDLDLVDLSRRTLELVDPLARKAQVRLAPPEPGARVEVCADAGALQQVLLNLVVNGIQAMPQGGPLRVEVGARGEEAVLSVIDAGVGIPEALRERIFEPFFTTKERGVGTGLGLCVVRDIVAEHGGSLAVESAPGQGTRIDVRLPLVQVGTQIA